MKFSWNNPRDRAVLEILAGLGMLFLIVFLAANREQWHLPGIVMGLAVSLLVSGGLYFYFRGCFALARAKGYGDWAVLPLSSWRHFVFRA